MKRAATIFVIVLLSLQLAAQTVFKTVVPQLPVISGESFQVQYIIEDGDKSLVVKPPAFSNFRFVTGPNIYLGSVSTVNGIKPLKNAVYTLEATRPGKFIIPGGTIIVNGKLQRSNDVLVEVISREEAIKRFNKENGIANSEYFLRPGENVYEKIRQNLFVKVLVDKKNCYVGQPVLATFKLYSRLESQSDIVKNPGFYGFTVYDMVNLDDKEVAMENINGKAFNVHTIRKVQLYPLQAGLFTIDPMEVKNKVEFSRSAVNKRTEQEVIEGVLGNDNGGTGDEGTEVFETDIKTEPVNIEVKPIPEKNKPAVFNGATGHFSIASFIAKSQLHKNEEGVLEIKISGRGNFIQLSAPTVRWPPGIEGFEPEVKDAFDKTKSPLAGSRTFRYPFVSSSPGTWQLPAVSFSFFDIDSNSYKTVSTAVTGITVSNESGAQPLTEEHTISIAEKNARTTRTAGIVMIIVVLLILIYWLSRKKETPGPSLLQQEQQPLRPSVRSLLEPAYEVAAEEGNKFYTVLHDIIWKFAGERFALSGSELSKPVLAVKMHKAGITKESTEQLLNIIGQCEAGIYTEAVLWEDRDALLNSTALLLEQLGSDLLKKA